MCQALPRLPPPRFSLPVFCFSYSKKHKTGREKQRTRVIKKETVERRINREEKNEISPQMCQALP